MTTKERAQIHMDDRIIDNPELEKILDDRQELKYALSEFRKKDKEAKSRIKAIEETPPFRIGRFLITSSTTPPRSVAFDTDGAVRIKIKIAGEE